MASGSFKSLFGRGDRERGAKQALRHAAVRALAEPLEGRVLLTTTVTGHTAPDVTAGTTSAEIVTVTYVEDTTQVSAGSIAKQNLVITPPSGGTPVVAAPAPSGDSKSITEAYSLAAPAGGWVTGTYTVAVQANVTNTENEAVQNPPTFTFQAQAPQDTTPPTASVANPPDINAATSNPQTVTVTYSDNVAVDVSAASINSGNISVSGSGGQLTVGKPVIFGSGQTVTVSYPVTAPGGSWDSADNGSYTVTYNSGTVRDTSNNVAGSAAPGHFNAAIAAADTIAPTASISTPPDINSATNNPQTITVTYTDNVAVDTSAGSINSGNISVTGSGGSLTVGTPTLSGGGKTVTATYPVTAPGGSWDAADDGAYTVSFNTGTVRDTSGNLAGSTQGSQFQVNIAAPDTIPPVAAFNTPADINAPTGNAQVIILTYTDNVAVDSSAASINAGNITVTGPNGALTVGKPVLTGSGKAVVAVYPVAGPGGSWDAADDGAYTVTFNNSQVKDTSGNPAGAIPPVGFKVNIAGPDTTPPTAIISPPPSITAATGNPQTITITYTDNIGINTGNKSINTGNITVTSPTGKSLNVTGVNVSGSGTTVIATYTVATPGKSWDATDNGAYTVTLKDGQVLDTSGNAASGTPAAQFVVAITPPDTTPPVAGTPSEANITADGASETVTVTYTDNVAVNLASIDAGDLTVTGPNGPLAVSLAGTTGGGKSITATYAVAAPGGSWDFHDNGTYTVSTVPGQVLDLSNNGTTNVAVSQFIVNIPLPDTTPPTASISAPPITAKGVHAQKITVTYTDDVAVAVASIDKNDITVTGPSGNVAVAAVSVTGGGPSVVATYTIIAPNNTYTQSDNGAYSVNLVAGQVVDTSNNAAVPLSPAPTFTINVAPPAPTDSDFAGGSGVQTQFVSEAVTNSPDGKIVVVGHQGIATSGQSQAVLERLNTDGSLDTTFGAAGQVVDPVGTNGANYAVTIQNGTFILTAGTMNGDFVVSRYTLSGQLDTSFGQGGHATADFGTPSDTAYSIALAPNGAIVLVGAAGGKFAFARFTATGQPDTTFAQAGRQLFNSGADTDVLGSVIVEGDGKIIAAGAVGASVALVRLDSSGSPDASFGNGGLLLVNGLVATQDNGLDRSEGLALESDGSILVANRTASGDFGVAHVNANGTLDTTFGNAGIASADFGGNDDADGILVEPSGPILAIGTTDAGGQNAAIAAFDSHGNLLTGFATGGKLTLPAGVTAANRELHVGDLVLRAFGFVQSNGQLLVGTSGQSTTTAMTSSLHRLVVPGAQDTVSETLLGTFGQNGKKNSKLALTLSDGTQVTFTLKGGSGTAFQSGNAIHLVVSASSGAMTIVARGGTGRVNLGDVTVTGTLKSFVGKTTDLSGTLYAGGAIGTLTLGNVTGTIASGGGSIGNVSVASLTNAQIISGANLGADGLIGGASDAADSFIAGSIKALKVGGAVTNSFIGAGINAVDGVFGDGDDTLIGGAASVIRSIFIRGSTDAATVFEAGAYPKSVKLPQKAVPATDARFKKFS